MPPDDTIGSVQPKQVENDDDLMRRPVTEQNLEHVDQTPTTDVSEPSTSVTPGVTASGASERATPVAPGAGGRVRLEYDDLTGLGGEAEPSQDFVAAKGFIRSLGRLWNGCDRNADNLNRELQAGGQWRSEVRPAVEAINGLTSEQMRGIDVKALGFKDRDEYHQVFSLVKTADYVSRQMEQNQQSPRAQNPRRAGELQSEHANDGQRNYDSSQSDGLPYSAASRRSPNAPEHSSDVSSEHSSDVSSEHSSDVSSEHSSDVSSEHSSDVSSEHSSDVSSEHSSDVSSEHSSDVSSEHSSDVSSEHSSDVSSEHSSDVSSELSQGGASRRRRDNPSKRSREDETELTPDDERSAKPAKRSRLERARDGVVKGVGLTFNFLNDGKLFAAAILATWVFNPAMLFVTVAAKLVLDFITTLFNKLMDRVLGRSASNNDRARNSERQNFQDRDRKHQFTRGEQKLVDRLKVLEEVFRSQISGWDSWSTRNWRTSFNIQGDFAKDVKQQALNNGIDINKLYNDLTKLAPKTAKRVLKEAGFENATQARALHDVLARQAHELSDVERTVAQDLKPLKQALIDKFDEYGPKTVLKKDEMNAVRALFAPGQKPVNAQAIKENLNNMDLWSQQRALKAAGFTNETNRLQVAWLVRKIAKDHSEHRAKEAKENTKAVEQQKKLLEPKNLMDRARGR